MLPSLREKHDEFMLRELLKRWTNHKIMVRWLSYFFRYLERYFIARMSLPALNEVGLTCFRDLVHTFFGYYTLYDFIDLGIKSADNISNTLLHFSVVSSLHIIHLFFE